MTSVASIAQPASNGIEAELTIGTKEEQVNTEVVIGDKQKVVNQNASTIENKNVTMPFMALVVILTAVGVVGWLLPVPSWLQGNKNG